MSVASLLLLTDARFPDGTHAHSYGLEAAVAAGRVRTVADLGPYLEARLWSTGRTEAAAAALAATADDLVPDTDAALAARTPGEATRRTSRALGRSLTRVAGRLWPDDPLPEVGAGALLQPVALGAVARRSGCDRREAALASTHGAAAALATAALRLLGLDPFSVTALLADLRPVVAGVADSVEEITGPAALPHRSTPLAELDAEAQPFLATRLFGS